MERFYFFFFYSSLARLLACGFSRSALFLHWFFVCSQEPRGSCDFSCINIYIYKLYTYISVCVLLYGRAHFFFILFYCSRLGGLLIIINYVKSRRCCVMIQSIRSTYTSNWRSAACHPRPALTHVHTSPRTRTHQVMKKKNIKTALSKNIIENNVKRKEKKENKICSFSIISSHFFFGLLSHPNALLLAALLPCFVFFLWPLACNCCHIPTSQYHTHNTSHHNVLFCQLIRTHYSPQWL